MASANMNLSFGFRASILLTLLFFGGCVPQPIVHKKVKKRPHDPFVVSSRADNPSADAPRLLQDDQVKAAGYLLPTFEERSERQLAAEALAQIGSEAIPELRLALGSPEPRVRREAVGVLARMGPDAKDAVPDLMRLLDDEDESIRKIAARALGRIGPDAAPAVPALMRTLLESQPAAPRR